jgi:hypothetical protein
LRWSRAISKFGASSNVMRFSSHLTCIVKQNTSPARQSPPGGPPVLLDTAATCRVPAENVRVELHKKKRNGRPP